jgi:hypothetical protein
MIKTLKNKDTAILVDDVKSINGFTIPAGTKIKMVNKLGVTAIIDLLPHINCPETKFSLYYRKVIKSEAMFAKVKNIRS